MFGTREPCKNNILTTVYFQVPIFSSDILKCSVSPRGRYRDSALATARFITYLYKSPLPKIVRKQNYLHRGNVVCH